MFDWNYFKDASKVTTIDSIGQLFRQARNKELILRSFEFLLSSSVISYLVDYVGNQTIFFQP